MCSAKRSNKNTPKTYPTTETACSVVPLSVAIPAKWGTLDVGSLNLLEVVR
jgi:hypothetical protein